MSNRNSRVTEIDEAASRGGPVGTEQESGARGPGDRRQPAGEQPVHRSMGERSTQKVAKERIKAGPCPRVPAHENTRVYKTLGRTRYCVCDDCGHNFKIIGPVAA